MGFSIPVPNGNIGVYASMERLAQIIRESSKRMTAPGVDRASQLAEVEGLTYWVRSHMTYAEEPGEELKRPEVLWDEIRRQGTAIGDCDDYVGLLGTFLASRGYPVKLVLLDRNDDGVWDHVALSVYTKGHAILDHTFADGVWIDVDAASEYAVGRLGAGTRRTEIEV